MSCYCNAFFKDFKQTKKINTLFRKKALYVNYINKSGRKKLYLFSQKSSLEIDCFQK